MTSKTQVKDKMKSKKTENKLEKKKRGRPKKKPEPPTVEKQIELMASFGMKNVEIADVLNIDDSTLKRNYEKFLAKGRADLKMALRMKQIEVAKKGNVLMLIWLGKNYLGQSDKAAEKYEKTEIRVRIINAIKR